ncbi:MAG: NAD(P)H-flavin reductase, partial [Planctomycetota bacterium]
MAKLIIQREGLPQRMVDLQPTNSIGRLKDCTVQLEDPQISRVHALITSAPEGFVLTDKGSMNGTQLNGKKLDQGQSTPLADGDVLGIQGFELRLELASTRPLANDKVDEIESQAALVELEKPPEASILLSHLLEDRSSKTVWSGGEISLRIADIIEETADTKTFRLVSDTGTLFSYKPGQFVTITVDIEGKKVKRSYSMSSSPSRPHTLELSIKRVPGGLVSNWMADRASLGDEILVRGPAGKFSCFNYPSRKMLCIAGGSGITPIMSMLRWIVDTTADVDVTLLYSGRSPSDFIFRKELETISARHSGLRVIFTVT